MHICICRISNDRCQLGTKMCPYMYSIFCICLKITSFAYMLVRLVHKKSIFPLLTGEGSTIQASYTCTFSSGSSKFLNHIFAEKRNQLVFFTNSYILMKIIVIELRRNIIKWRFRTSNTILLYLLNTYSSNFFHIYKLKKLYSTCINISWFLESYILFRSSYKYNY